MSDTPRRRRTRRDTPSPAPQDSQEPREKPRDDLPRHTRSIVIAGSKGGVGASLFAANASIYLAQLGNRVTLVDADPSTGNLHTLLGIQAPQGTLSDLFHRRVEELCVETRVEGLDLLASAAEPVADTPQRRAQRLQLMSLLSLANPDFLLIDAGPGVSEAGLEHFLSARLGVLVVSPEPTAVEAAYRFLVAAFFRHLQRLKWPTLIERRIQQLQGELTGLPLPTPRQLIEEAKNHDPETTSLLERELWNFRPAVLISQARARGDGEVGEALRAACRRKLGIWIEPLGYIDFEDDAWISVRRQRPLVIEKPDSTATQQIQQVVHRMLAAISALEALPKEPIGPVLMPPLEAQTHYELLGIPPGASEEEIRRVQKRMRLIYADDSVGLYGAYRPDEIERVQRRMTEAYDCLIDQDKRRAYDLAVFPAGHPGRHWIEEAAARSRAASLAELPEETPSTPILEKNGEPVLPPDAQLSGAWLRALRESRGINLADIATRTKISLQGLQWIEDDAFDKMAAPVYVRGFVLEFARCLKLDAERVARAYVDRYRAWLEQQAARAR